MKRKFTKYPSNYVRASEITASKVLKIKHNNRIDTYEFRYASGDGDVFEPKAGSGNWWTSYIVTPDKRLFSWDLNGRYTPCSDVYGDTFWVEDSDIAACNKVTASLDLDNLDYLVSNVYNSLGIDYRDDGDWIYYFSDEDGRYGPASYVDLDSFYTKLVKNKTYHGFKPVKNLMII